MRIGFARLFSALACVAALLLATSSVSYADDQVEIGTTLVSLSAGLGDNDSSTLSLPGSTFAVGSPGIYASFFLTPQVSVEPQLGLVFASTRGNSSHWLNVNGQVNYFVDGTKQPSAYVFGLMGVTDLTGGPSPLNVGLGVGYRIPSSGRLVFRLDARFQHLTDGYGNLLGLGLSLGGLF